MNKENSENITVIDIGNSRLKMLAGKNYFSTDYRSNWKQILTHQLNESDTKEVFYSSVNAKIENGFVNLANENLIMVHNAAELLSRQQIVKFNQVAGAGNDRLFGMLGAMSMSGPPLITIDIGTAVTINFISYDAVFIGGTIFPGFRLQANALKKNTSGLKSFELLDNTPVIGKNTSEAITCGIYNSISGGIVQIIKTAIKTNNFPDNMPVFLTGGSSGKIINTLTENLNIVYEQHLILKGILSTIKYRI